MIKELEFPVPPPTHPTSGERTGSEDCAQSPMDNDLINRAYVMKPLEKNQKDSVQKASGLVNTWICRESSLLREHESSVPLCHTLPHTSLSSGCFQVTVCPFIIN